MYPLKEVEEEGDEEEAKKYISHDINKSKKI